MRLETAMPGRRGFRSPGDDNVLAPKRPGVSGRIGPLNLPGRQDLPFPRFHRHAGLTEGLFHTQGGDTDHLPLMLFHRGKIEGRLSRDDPQASHFLQLRIVPAAGQKRLRGNAAPVGAGSAPEIFLDDRRPGAVTGGMPCQGMAAGPCTDDNQVKYIRHDEFPPIAF